MYNHRENKEFMDWIKKHTDTFMLLGALFGGFLWMNGKFNDLDRRLVRIETILYVKGIISQEVAYNDNP
jgi:hypothetical protein